MSSYQLCRTLVAPRCIGHKHLDIVDRVGVICKFDTLLYLKTEHSKPKQIRIQSVY